MFPLPGEWFNSRKTAIPRASPPTRRRGICRTQSDRQHPLGSSGTRYKARMCGCHGMGAWLPGKLQLDGFHDYIILPRYVACS